MRDVLILGILYIVSALLSPAHAQTAGPISQPVSPNNIIPNEYIVRFKEAPSVAQLQEAKEESGVVSTKPLSSMANTYIYRTNGTLDRAETLQAYSDVDALEVIEPERLMSFFVIPNDPDYSKQWALSTIQSDRAWDQLTGSPSVIVAVIDSGCDASHPDLAVNIVETKVFDDPQFLSPHGTHICGIIGGVGNNSAGISGANWRIGIMALKADAMVGGFHGLRMSKVVDAIAYATQNGADIINLSLGGNASQILQDAIDQATAQGIIVVAAAGNTASQNYNLFPAAWPNVISVSATGPNDEFAPYSSFGKVDVSAPGGNVLQDRNGDGKKNSADCIPEECIYSTVLQNGYGSLSGTSMAAPYVSGTAALMLAAKPQLSASEVRSLLESTAVDLGDAGKDIKFGSGRVDSFAAVAAVQASSGGTLPQPTGPAPSGGGSSGSGASHPCFAQADTGDYNCDNTIAINDFQSWRQDFAAGINFASLVIFEKIREALFH